MNLNRVLGLLAAILLLGAVGLWFGTHLEVKRVKHVIPPAAYVRADHYYALAHILAPTLKVRRYVVAAKIDLSGSALVVVDARSLDSLHKARLTQWVARGGLLMITFSGASTAPRAVWWRGTGPFAGLAPRFEPPPGPSQQTQKSSPGARTTSSPRPSSGEKNPVVLVDTTVSFPDAKRDHNTAVVRYRGRTNVAVRSWGKGKVIVCGAPLFLINRNLEERDDLQFTDFIFGSLMSHPGEIVWLPKPSAPSVAASFQVDTGPITIAALVVFFLLVWMKAPRFGPALPEPPEDSRSLRARFRAEGRFLWRHRAGSWLVDRMEGPDPVHEPAESDPTHEERTANRSGTVGRGPSRQAFIDVVARVVDDVDRTRGIDRRRADSIGRKKHDS